MKLPRDLEWAIAMLPGMNRGRAVKIPELVQGLKISEKQAGRILRKLGTEGLILHMDGGYYLDPQRLDFYCLMDLINALCKGVFKRPTAPNIICGTVRAWLAESVRECATKTTFRMIVGYK